VRTAGAIVSALALGAILGLGGFIFFYAKGSSYVTNDPAACANCHLMREHSDGWTKSSHRSVAVCNDCHTPHDIVGKYATKAGNGYRHSLAFTTGRFEEPLQIKQSSSTIVEDACRNCHGDIVQAIDGPHRPEDDRATCVRCHAGVGH
jgi:cytochrome c nitrite reductase small subunit